MHNEKHSGKKAGKYCRGRRKNAVLIFALILLLGITIGGNIAYLVKESSSVVNDFIPANVEISIQEKVANNVKEKIVIENKSNIPVFIRVALVGNWADADDKICINHGSTQPSFTLGADWVKGSDGFYYYKKSVAIGGETSDLLGSNIELTAETDGCSYQIEVIASAIQAKDNDDTDVAVYDVWGIDPTSLQ